MSQPSITTAAVKNAREQWNRKGKEGEPEGNTCPQSKVQQNWAVWVQIEQGKVGFASPSFPARRATLSRKPLETVISKYFWEWFPQQFAVFLPTDERWALQMFLISHVLIIQTSLSLVQIPTGVSLNPQKHHFLSTWYKNICNDEWAE